MVEEESDRSFTEGGAIIFRILPDSFDHKHESLRCSPIIGLVMHRSALPRRFGLRLALHHF